MRQSCGRQVNGMREISSRENSPIKKGSMGTWTNGQLMKYLIYVADKEVQIDIFREMLCSSPDFDPYKLFAYLDTDAKGAIDSADLWEFIQRTDPGEYFPMSASNSIIAHYDHSSLTQLNYRDFLRFILPWRSSVSVEKSINRRSMMRGGGVGGGYDDDIGNETVRCLARLMAKEAEYMTELNTRKEYLLARLDFTVSDAFNYLDSFLNLGLDRDGDAKVMLPGGRGSMLLSITYAEFRDHFLTSNVSSSRNRSTMMMMRSGMAARDSMEMKSMWRGIEESKKSLRSPTSRSSFSGDTSASSRKSNGIKRRTKKGYPSTNVLYVLRCVRDLGRRDNRIDKARNDFASSFDGSFGSLWAEFDTDGKGIVNAKDISQALAHIGFGMSVADCRVILNYYSPDDGTLNFTDFAEMILPVSVEARKAAVIREQYGMEHPEDRSEVCCLLEKYSGAIEKLFLALFEEASTAQELTVNEDALRMGFSELDSLGGGVVDTSVLLSALDENGLQASLAEEAAILKRFDPTGNGRVPNACKNFLALAASGYYDGTKFHRLIPGFMVQGGDPTGTGKGGANWEGGKQKDEFVSSVKHDRRGILSFANNGPDTIGSQFFITFGRQPHLNGVYTAFGRLIDGMDTLMKIEQVPVGKKHRPTKDIVIGEKGKEEE
ncbi:Cyclin-dependent kinases regulatory subunit 2 [Perkinsus chesapeaki]|uniref:Cyclin-dependent kinases regulatory subunit 2 n=1 Tax=Perkinsus chesapeaki TaxID=330153 RepID=A0A7J6LH89_PERCH|nr:Cyclin-dependent kinases regulatory subunit 2 [Perkinsus chesapeaki]